MKIVPRGDWIIGRTIEAPDELPGQIVLPETMKLNLEGRAVMEVVAIGPDVNKPAHCPEVYKPTGDPIEVGQRLAYVKNEKQTIMGMDTKPLVMVMVHNIIGLVAEDERATAEQFKAAQARVDRINEETRRSKGGDGKILVPGPVLAGRRPLNLAEGAGRV